MKITASNTVIILLTKIYLKLLRKLTHFNLHEHSGNYIEICGCFLFQYLTPNVDCSKVTRPDTKNMVLSTSLMASVLFAKHIGPLRINGMAKVPPNMVR